MTLQVKVVITLASGKSGMDRGASRQEHQVGHIRRGPLHLQAQRQGKEGQVVPKEPGGVGHKYMW